MAVLAAAEGLWSGDRQLAGKLARQPCAAPYHAPRHLGEPLKGVESNPSCGSPWTTGAACSVVEIDAPMWKASLSFVLDLPSKNVEGDHKRELFGRAGNNYELRRDHNTENPHVPLAGNRGHS